MLDVGCGEGELLELLRDDKGVDGRGMEISAAGVNDCVGARPGGRAGRRRPDLVDYPDRAFDYVDAVPDPAGDARSPRDRAGASCCASAAAAIVSFPNFGHWRMRVSLLFGGRMPVTENLPYAWYDTPNIHFCTIRDFVELVRRGRRRIERPTALEPPAGRSAQAPWWFWNLFGEQAVFLLSR